ncbi:MAG: protein phosphatase 2C domain-containing protein [Anaerolineales bacterium]|nr:protein phosphatase 2C domain-containing protein [Anaerolineales bacterium]
MITTGSIIGRSHRLMQQNCQDAAVGGTLTPDVAFGLVLDGCGSKYREESGIHPSHNEIGAHLLGAYADAFLQQALTAQDIELDSLPARLYQACLTYLDCLVTLHPFQTNEDRHRFIATHLLATLVGFVVTPETAVCFWAGDGYLRINDNIIPLESNNHPDYLAYQLLPGRENGRFHTLTVRERDNLNRLAVATDGWRTDLLSTLPETQTNLALQRWLNVQARTRGNFEDDGAIAVYNNES